MQLHICLSKEHYWSLKATNEVTLKVKTVVIKIFNKLE